MPLRSSRMCKSTVCLKHRSGWGGIPLVGERLVGIWNSIDQQGAAMMLAIKPYLGQVGNWLLARSAQIGGGILELTLSIVFVFFFSTGTGRGWRCLFMGCWNG